MSQPLGELVDRLVITNLKLWFVQDAVHKAAKENSGLDADTVQKLAKLNLERNRLMTAIEETINDAIQAGGTTVDPRVKIT